MDKDCYNLTYCDGYIYYSIREPDNPEKEGCLYGIKTGGTDEKKLSEEPAERIYDMRLDDENRDLYWGIEDEEAEDFSAIITVNQCLYPSLTEAIYADVKLRAK